MEGRCAWAKGEMYEKYHDEEWGVPLHDERLLFESLVLDGAQAGLSWATILARREGYRAAYEGFDPRRIAKYGDADVARLLADTRIIRNRAKVAASVSNAQSLLNLYDGGGSLDQLLWGFVDGRPKLNRHAELAHIPATSAESDAMSKELKRLGFKFCGSTICYAFMQAVGMVNDHLVSCPRWEQVQRLEL